ncbi:MAG TPA: glycosyltransferase, partial [Chloroflexota bacterium]
RLVDSLQVVHLSGRGRAVPAQTASAHYRSIEFLLDDMPHLLAAATLVVSRAGMGTLSELAALGKASLIVPMPGSHQWANAQAFARLGAIEVADQEALTPERLAERVLGLVSDEARRQHLGQALSESMPRDAAERIASVLLDCL